MSKKLTLNEFIEKSNKIHNNKYDYSNTIYISAITKIEIRCKYHNEIFFQSPNSHSNGSGCPKCGIESRRLLCVKNTSGIINEFRVVHGTDYDYSKVNYKNAIKKVCIICPKHGEFYQTPDKHLSGNKCPKCNISHGEFIIIKFLDNNNINYEYQKIFSDCINPKDTKKHGRLKFDFYIPHKNLLIEFDGKQHFECSNIKGKHRLTSKELNDLQFRDNVKNNYAIRNNIKFLRIKYTEINKIVDILTKELMD